MKKGERTYVVDRYGSVTKDIPRCDEHLPSSSHTDICVNRRRHSRRALAMPYAGCQEGFEFEPPLIHTSYHQGFAGAVVIFVVGIMPASAQEGRIAGRVLDETSARPLSLVQISIASLTTGTMSDVEGSWTIRSIPPGTYELTVQRLGYTTKTITGVVVVDSEVTTLNVSLATAALELEDITVTTAAAESGNTAAVLANRKTAAAVTDAIGREQISGSPDSDAAAAMARVPGVSIVDKKIRLRQGAG